MLTPKATGAAAKPFETHHNALDIPLYARVAPELYLKRLVVGGFEKVYELNRNFRNEGLSQRHNPEFTMLEFYVAYMDVNGMMDLAETMIKDAVAKANEGSLVVKYGENEIDFGKFQRTSMENALLQCEEDIFRDIPANSYEKEVWVTDKDLVCAIARFLRETKKREYDRQRVPHFREGVAGLTPLHRVDESEIIRDEGWQEAAMLHFPNPEIEIRGWNQALEIAKNSSIGDYWRAIIEIFDIVVETSLIDPTFIIDYPKSISPLSKASPENPNIAERFELFINGMEVANGFSELNDPKEQYERFVDQMSERERGDEEAMILDEDYIRALSYGMPPAAGIGIGIDRLVMLLTNKHSIRDVILFPHMRPERKEGEKVSGGEAAKE